MQVLLTVLRYLTFIIAIGGVYGIFRVSRTIKAAESEIPLAPPQPPPARPYDRMIAANGIIESFEENVIIAAPMAVFSMAAKLAFLVFGPMMDIKLLFMYSGVFKRRVVLALLIGLFILIGALSEPWMMMIQKLATK